MRVGLSLYTYASSSPHFAHGTSLIWFPESFPIFWNSSIILSLLLTHIPRPNFLGKGAQDTAVARFR